MGWRPLVNIMYINIKCYTREFEFVLHRGSGDNVELENIIFVFRFLKY